MAIRQWLFDQIRAIARRDQLADYTLADTIHTSRSRASRLLHGRIEDFNSETLIDILARLGITVELQVVRVQLYSRGYFPNPAPNWRPHPNRVYG